MDRQVDTAGRVSRARASAVVAALLCLMPLLSGCGTREAPPTAPTGSPAGTVPPGSSVRSSPPVVTATPPPGTVPTKARPRIVGDRQADTPAEPIRMSVQKETSPFRFAEIHQEAGIDFVHFSGMTQAKHFPTANGSGVAVFDYDNDGKLDIYFATCTMIPVGSVRKGPNRLYRNLGANKFEDVTEKAGVGYAGFCHGVVAGDIDNDGDKDLFLCNYGPNVLYRNNGNGTFTDVSKSAGIHRPALVVALLFDQASTPRQPDAVTIDAVAGPGWKIGEAVGVKHRVPVRKGTRLVVRQADPESPRGITFRNPELVQRAGEPDKPTAVVREIGSGPSKVDTEVPSLAKGASPAPIAEFEVLREFDVPLIFTCKIFDRAWSSAGAFLDSDNDGDLDLYVSNYGEWDYPEDDQFCGDTAQNIRLYCSPRNVRTVRHFFFRNNGNGTFSEVYDSVIRSIDLETRQHKPRSDGHGFGVVTADLNGDGKIDIYVANDMNPNFLFLNKGDGTFEDATESAGAAYDDKGQAQSGMGVDAEDVNGDGLPELFVTNFSNEYNTLYQNMGQGIFSDSTPYFGLAADTMPWVAWGTALVDLDNDGWPDNFVANGHVDDNRHDLGQNIDYAEPPLLFSNRAGQRFRLATRDAGPYFDSTHVARGAAFGDLDNDGDVDIVVNHKDSAPALLRNDTKNANHWIRVELEGTRSNREGIGARLEVTAGGRTIHRQRKGGYSLESSHDPRVHFGIGTATVVEKLVVRWPSGLVSTLEHLKPDQPHKVVEPK